MDYMSSQGVTSSNLVFYLGTHPHSDHIDNADDIIYRFRPKAIFSPEYSDSWISDPRTLWDNQWVYDRMIAAASWAQRSYGATLVQHVRDYGTHVQIGDMDIQIIPFDPEESYKHHPIRDANLLGWGSVVSAFGHRAFLAADLELRVFHGRPLALDDHPDEPRMGDPGPPDDLSHCERHCVVGPYR
jgi:choline binding protein E